MATFHHHVTISRRLLWIGNATLLQLLVFGTPTRRWLRPAFTMAAHTTVLHENEIWALDGESELESLNIDWILDTGSSLEEIK